MMFWDAVKLCVNMFKKAPSKSKDIKPMNYGKDRAELKTSNTARLGTDGDMPAAKHVWASGKLLGTALTAGRHQLQAGLPHPPPAVRGNGEREPRRAQGTGLRGLREMRGRG